MVSLLAPIQGVWAEKVGCSLHNVKYEQVYKHTISFSWGGDSQYKQSAQDTNIYRRKEEKVKLSYLKTHFVNQITLNFSTHIIF